MSACFLRARLVLASALMLLWPATGVAQQEGRDEDRATIQRRFAPKTNMGYAQGVFTTHVRNDFFSSFGGGLDVGYFFDERWGAEVRVIGLRTQLGRPAQDLQTRLGLVPDARKQDLWAQGGVRWSPAYGKMLWGRKFVVHFDPQLVAHAGIARAEGRVLPSLGLGGAAQLHFAYDIKVKLDLGISVQAERRERGWVVTTGFVPVVGVGWGYTF